VSRRGFDLLAEKGRFAGDRVETGEQGRSLAPVENHGAAPPGGEPAQRIGEEGEPAAIQDRAVDPFHTERMGTPLARGDAAVGDPAGHQVVEHILVEDRHDQGGVAAQDRPVEAIGEGHEVETPGWPFVAEAESGETRRVAGIAGDRVGLDEFAEAGRR
jgi:hypothetical protein